MHLSYEEDESAWYACILYGTPLMFNASNVYWIFTGIFVVPDYRKSLTVMISTFSTAVGFNLFYFLYKKRFKTIELKYINETKTHKIIGIICVIFYVLLSILLAIIA